MAVGAQFETEILRMPQQPALPNAAYFNITLLVDIAGNIQWGIQTHWRGFTETTTRREIRDGTLYQGDAQRTWLFAHGERALPVNSENDLRIWMAFGGHGLILEEIGRSRFESLVTSG